MALAVENARLVEALNPITRMKAIKNEAEMDGFRQSHARDAVALVRNGMW